jgi:glycine/D-amino acid oxidase-like deaminating enzyme
MHRRRTDPGPAEPVSYWLRGERRPADPPLLGAIAADVVVIGAGFTGLWTALALTETDPAIDVVVVEAETVAYGASGRNGGFCEASLTHGLANGIRHFRDELDRLEAEGLANLRALVDFTREHGIACDLEETGTLSLADRPHQVDEFRAWVDEAAAYGEHLEFMDRATAQAEVHSPTWQAALYRPPGRDAMLDPAALCRGLARVARERGIRIFEGSPVERLDRVAGGVVVRTRGGATIRTDQVVVATSAYSGWLRRLRSTFIPVYDYVLVSEPLTPDERAAIGWARRQGLSDANNQFHYFRLTADDRILWGGYDAIHHFGSRVGPELDRRPATFAKLEAQFVHAFPQLEGLRFPYRWGGAIDTTTRFTVTFGQTMGGRVTYALGYTGLGVGASRWAGGVVRDFILRPDEDRLGLRIVQRAPVPFPPEPFRSVAVNAVRHDLDRADRAAGRRSMLLRTLDALGIGFDS